MDPRARVVLGGSGFLGAHLTAALVARARALATMADPHGPAVVRVARDPAAGPCFCQPRGAARDEALDLTVPGALETLLDREQPGLVVNCAALSRGAECEADPELARALNVDLAARAAGWSAANGARFLHLSTDLAFGHPSPEGEAAGTRRRENDDPAPIGVYAETKVAGEQAVLAAYPDALVVRLPLLYGNSGGRGLGASDSLLDGVERDAEVVLFTDEWRTPLEVSNAAGALAELSEGRLTGLLHLAGPDRVSRYELGLAVLEEMGLDPETLRTAVRAATRGEVGLAETRPTDVSLDATRAGEQLETELIGVREGVRRALR